MGCSGIYHGIKAEIYYKDKGGYHQGIKGDMLVMQ